MNEAMLREQLCQGAYQLWLRGMVFGGAGLVSAEVHRRRFLASPPGLRWASLMPDQLAVVDLGGEDMAGETNFDGQLWQPHRVAYQVGLERETGASAGARIGATTMTLPPSLIALLRQHPHASRLELAGCSLPVVEPGDDAAVRQALVEHEAVAVRQVGLLSVGRDVWGALNEAERMAWAAATQIQALQLTERLDTGSSSG